MTRGLGTPLPWLPKKSAIIVFAQTSFGPVLFIVLYCSHRSSCCTFTFKFIKCSVCVEFIIAFSFLLSFCMPFGADSMVSPASHWVGAKSCTPKSGTMLSLPSKFQVDSFVTVVYWYSEKYCLNTSFYNRHWFGCCRKLDIVLSTVSSTSTVGSGSEWRSQQHSKQFRLTEDQPFMVVSGAESIQRFDKSNPRTS